MKQNFIRTSFDDVAIKLRELGFKELPKQGEFYFFLNSSEIRQNFSDEDKKNISFTNMMYT